MNETAILVITQDFEIYEQCRCVLGSREYLVQVAENGEEGLQLFQSNRYDLVFIEMGIEKFNGNDLITRLRQHDPEVVIVLITGDEAVSRADIPAEWGAYDMLKQPFLRDEFLQVVDQALEHRRLTLEIKRLQAIEVEARRLAEERTRLDELDRAKAAFIRLVTHELQAPVSAILSYLDLMIKGYIPPADQRKILEIARDRAREQLNMIADLIELGRMKEMAFPNLPTPVQVEEVLEKVIRLFTTQAAAKEIQLSTDVAPGLDPVSMVEDQVKSIWTNLLSNAIKYTPAGGKILIVLRQEGGHLLGQVIDTGIGIPEYALGSLFSEFYRAANAKSLNIPGSGLGLAIVRQIVQKAGGNIWVESVEGKGSTFSFILPILNYS